MSNDVTMLDETGGRTPRASSLEGENWMSAVQQEHHMTTKQVWLITGAGRGMGVDIAKAALAAGHAVVATGRDPKKVAEALGGHDDLLVVKLDVTRPEDA